jgi:hypothetical protein
MFHLRKWYLDVVDADGRALIAYWARLRWGPLDVRYAATLTTAGAGMDEHTTLRAGREPEATADGLAWTCPRLGLRGTWRRRLDAVRIPLLDTPGQTIDWHCHLPAGEAEVTVGGTTLRGAGYGECLTMTLPPWRLPCATLRWGRAVGARRSLVWIAWAGGAHPRRWLVAEGIPHADATGACGEERVALPAGDALALAEPRVLRDGELGAVVAAVPGLALLIPRRLRRARETKWLSRARWADGDAGWAIHEVVRWA